MIRRRVLVRGVGAFTPLGATWPETCRALAAGQTSIRPVEHFDVRGFPCTVASAVVEPLGQPDRRVPLAQRAAREAWEQADVPRGRTLGVFVGAESGRPPFSAFVGMARAAGEGRFARERFSLDERSLAFRGAAASPAAVASGLASEYGATGPVATVSLACASGAAALIEAVRALRLGECDVALCGGVGADVDPFTLAGFGLLGALSARGRSRPFDVHRDGFVLGEGAAMAVLCADDGPGLAEVSGVGRTQDAFHITAPEPAGDGAAQAMSLALREAGLDEVGYVQAHGTSTPLNDEVEARALQRVLGDALARTPVSSVKGALGHTIAASGALGFLCAVEAVRTGTVLPTAGLQEPDPACALSHVRDTAVTRDVPSALCNAFAFGGANCSLLVRRRGA